MWGNSLGWLISGVIVALCAGALYIVNTASAPTPPTAFSADERNFAPISLPPAPVVPSTLHAGAQRSDAPGRYVRAIDLVKADSTLYESFAQSGKLDSPEANKLEAIDVLVEASSDSDLKCFADDPKQIITFAHSKPALDALQTLGKVCIDRLGLLSARAGKPDDAQKYYRAGLALGWSLSSERLTYDEYQLGQELLSKASAALASLAEQTSKPDEAVAWRDFDARRLAENKLHVDPVLRIVRSIDASVVGPRSGDVFELAKRSRERMWRVEAILALGRMRYFAGAGGTAANQRNANRFLHGSAENDADPIIRAAAAAARDLTIEEYRMQ